MRIYKIAANGKPYEFFHGTDSPPFEKYDPSKATKGPKFYNPLGEALYVTDKPDFAKMFGKNIYPVQLPSDAKVKRVSPTKASSALRDIILKALKKVGIDYWENTDLQFKVELSKELELAQHSPYETIMNAIEVVNMRLPHIAKEFREWVPKIATQKFSKYDAIIFVGTNNPNDIFIGESPTKEILIFNKEFQKAIQPQAPRNENATQALT